MFQNYIFIRGLYVLCCPNWGLYVRGLFDLDSYITQELNECQHSFGVLFNFAKYLY